MGTRPLTNRIGRPRLEDTIKKTRVSMTISKETLAAVESKRGSVSRSQYIESVLDVAHQSQATQRYQLKQNGAVYTPRELANFVAERVVGYIFSDIFCGIAEFKGQGASINGYFQNMRILDPACGNGELLYALWNQLTNALKKSSRLKGIASKLDLRQILCGIDIDQIAIQDAKKRLLSLEETDENANEAGLKILHTNALIPFNQKTSHLGWEVAKHIFDADKGFDIVIANPPWGADVTSYKDKLSAKEFSLYQGQFDTADLFMELGLSQAKPGGYIAFIIPDSLFNQERRALRELLVKHTEIKSVARLGEKLFENINRACAVVICRRAKPKEDNRIDCFRLTPNARKRILAGESTFAKEQTQLGHGVYQARFNENRDFLFDIDVRTEEEGTLNHFRTSSATLGTYLSSTRGVELSKYGLVCKCSNCGKWLPQPTGLHLKCHLCGFLLGSAAPKGLSIIKEIKANGDVPLLVGESIRRYSIEKPFWISLNYDGINYKEPYSYESPKLVLRKTGVGLCAAIDYSGAYTNQVVYIFRCKHELKNVIPLEFFLGIINSRAMYYFLTKNHGETEWRSHPYVTQSQILALPIPNWRLLLQSGAVEEIAEALKPYTTQNKEIPNVVDVQVERLVSRIYGLTRKDYRVIYNTLDTVQELRPIIALKKVGLSEIFP